MFSRRFLCSDGTAPVVHGRRFLFYVWLASETVARLLIVKELRRVLDGAIHFESREGLGTTFDIRFPSILKLKN